MYHPSTIGPGVSFAWALQGVYFERKGLSFLQQWKFVKTHLNDYLSFGAVQAD